MMVKTITPNLEMVKQINNCPEAKAIAASKQSNMKWGFCLSHIHFVSNN